MCLPLGIIKYLCFCLYLIYKIALNWARGNLISLLFSCNHDIFYTTTIQKYAALTFITKIIV